MTREKGMVSVADARRRVEAADWKPRNAVWELTLECNLRCRHCGSNAGRARPDELTLEECLEVAGQLADLGCELVTLSGGEPTLKTGWEQIAAALSGRGVLVNMVTNGVYADAGRAAEIAGRAVAAGMCNAGMSIDGPEQIHDLIRGRGTFGQTLASIGEFVRAGVKVGVLTTVNRINFPYLDQIRQIAADSGATMWRLQLAKPMGSLARHDDWVLTPAQYMELVGLLARLKRTPGIHLAVGDSIGYYGRHDKVLRGRGWRGRAESWQGCQAGMQAIGIEADGGIKGCLSLQAKWGDRDPFVEGNVRLTRLTDLWYRPGVFAYNRDFDADSLTGSCAACKHSRLCRGGARCVSSSFLGHVNEDPYCYYRLESLLNGNQEGNWTRAAGAAAAALVLSLGAAGCELSSDEKPKGGSDTSKDMAGNAEVLAPDQVDEPDGPCCGPEYGVFPEDLKPQPDVQMEYGIPPDAVSPDVQPEYGIPPDVVEPDVQMDYGIPPDVVVPDVQMEYGIPPDAVHEDVKGEINCEEVCCMCEYGISIPEEVWKECCEDPCANACCECDYGEPPPPECCK